MTGFDFRCAAGEIPVRAAYGAVTIEVDILPIQVATVRVVAADLAARADFDLDAVSDLRLAVDEACSTLATMARPGSRLHCTLQVDLDRITVTARIPEPEYPVISRSTFGWRVLATLADEAEIIAERDSGTPSLGIRLVKTRQGTTA
ncbi:MAG: ATP-binding protein [Pseudonocardiaceae bacterium]